MNTSNKPSVHVFSEMLGKTICFVDGLGVGSGRVDFHSVEGDKFSFFYEPDCCARCSVEDVCGDVNDLTSSPLVIAEEVTSYDHAAPKYAESYTWTFYRFATSKGTVTVRWLGESNGYYSESVTYKHRKG